VRGEDIQLCLRRAQPPDQPGKGLLDAAECHSYLAEVTKLGTSYLFVYFSLVQSSVTRMARDSRSHGMKVGAQVDQLRYQVVNRICGLAPPARREAAGAAPLQRPHTQCPSQQPAASEARAQQADSGSGRGGVGSGGGVHIVTFPLLTSQPQLLSLLQRRHSEGHAQPPDPDGQPSAATAAPTSAHAGAMMPSPLQHAVHARRSGNGRGGSAAAGSGGSRMQQRDEETQVVWALPQDAAVQSDLFTSRDAATAASAELPPEPAAARSAGGGGGDDSQPESQPPASDSDVVQALPAPVPHEQLPAAGDGDGDDGQAPAGPADTTPPPLLLPAAEGGLAADAAGSSVAAAPAEAHADGSVAQTAATDATPLPADAPASRAATAPPLLALGRPRQPPLPLPAWEPPKVHSWLLTL